MDGSKIEQNVVQASESSSIVETEGSTLPSLSTSACPVSSDTRDDGYGDSIAVGTTRPGVGFAKIIVDGLEILDLAVIPLKTTHGDSWWSCRKAGGLDSYPGTNKKNMCPDSSLNIRTTGGCGTDRYTARGYYGSSFDTQSARQGEIFDRVKR